MPQARLSGHPDRVERGGSAGSAKGDARDAETTRPSARRDCGRDPGRSTKLRALSPGLADVDVTVAIRTDHPNPAWSPTLVSTADLGCGVCWLVSCLDMGSGRGSFTNRRALASDHNTVNPVFCYKLASWSDVSRSSIYRAGPRR